MLGRLIVRFKTYNTAENHKADLTAALAQAGGAWQWVDRQNAASLYPTDFALLEVADAVSDDIKVSNKTCNGALSAPLQLQESTRIGCWLAEPAQLVAWSQRCSSRATSKALLDLER